MELFYAYEVSPLECRLDAEESAHCVRVLRHRTGDPIDVIDGKGTLYHCQLLDDSPKGASARVLSVEEGFGGHPYRLCIGCCPTKNNDRFEWFVEKATEIGVDVIAPLIGEHSERKVYKTERALRIALSATKQSLKARIPEIMEPVSVKDFILSGDKAGTDARGSHGDADAAGSHSNVGTGDGHSTAAPLRLIAYCFEDPSVPRISIREALEGYSGQDVTVLIGPEGDFSPAEAKLALEHGYIPVHLGTSRLRTETAAVTAAEAVYFRYM